MSDRNEHLKKRAVGAMGGYDIPFNQLPYHQNPFAVDKEFVDKWVAPYYMSVAKYGEDWIEPVKAIKHEISREVTQALLGELNWRMRLVGAYFSAVKNFEDQVDIIGTHLLKSQTCCVGHMYALVLSFFNTEASNRYIDTYLEYYLTKPKLYFDQQKVMSARLYLDQVNGTSTSEKHLENWNSLKKTWNIEDRKPTIEYFEEQVSILKQLNNDHS